MRVALRLSSLLLSALLHAPPRGVVPRARRHGIKHPLNLQRIRERRPGLLAPPNVTHEVDDLVREIVLVAEAVSGRPPIADIRMLRLGHEDATEPARIRPVIPIEVLK